MATLSAGDRPKRVLVIEDPDRGGDPLSGALAGRGFVLSAAAYGAAAIARAEADPPDVVVCDLHIAQRDGLSALRAIARFDDAIALVLRSDDGEGARAVAPEGVFDVVDAIEGVDALAHALRRAAEHGAVRRENRRLAELLRNGHEALERRVVERTAELAEANARLEASLAAHTRSEARFRSLVQNASDLIVVVGDAGRIAYESPAAQRLLSRALAEGAEAAIWDAVHPEDVERARRAAADVLATPGATARCDLRFVHRDGSARWLEIHLANLTDDPSVGGVVWTGRDVTERLDLEQRLGRDAQLDSLTELGNRRLLRARLLEALAEARRRGAPLSLLTIDLDDFKPVNDSLGHATGDEVLKGTARRLRACARPGDTCARLGGDDFAMVLPNAGAAEAVAVARRVSASLAAPHRAGGADILLGSSIGIAVSDAGAEGPDDLLRDADLAMSAAKRRGGGHELFRPEMHAAMAANVALRLELRRAVERNEFFLEYQPVVALSTGRIVGVEALVRWRHPERGIVPPGVFIGLAEDTGLIVPLGRWVLREACAMLERRGGGFSLSVNVSARQLLRDELVDDVAAAIADTGIDPSSLVLEVTESIALEERQPTLFALRGLGVRLAIDDFGTGYSSLAYLRRLPVDAVKIHKSFVDGVAGGTGDAQLARAILRFGQEMGLRTTAEGIEHAEQWNALRELGCDLGQGYYFSRPVQEDRLTAAIASLPPPAS